jgi:hypothetical protein
MEGIYRYRFQGTIFEEREGFLTSSDAGASFHAAFPANYGDFHVGIYNGEGYSKAEANNQKALQLRGSLRPLPVHPILRGWRLTGFYDADNYVANASSRWPRSRRSGCSGPLRPGQPNTISAARNQVACVPTWKS